MTTDLILSPAPDLLPARLFAPTPKAARRVVEFFTAQINNDHTRKAYLNAARRFAAWCEAHSLQELADVQAFHVAAFIKDLQGQFTPPTVKQHLAALRMLFDWLVTGHIIDVNPAHAVRGPKYVVKKGKTPVLNVDEARDLLDAAGQPPQASPPKSAITPSAPPASPPTSRTRARSNTRRRSPTTHRRARPSSTTGEAMRFH